MEQSDRVSLDWSEFESNIQSTFASLRRQEHFSDVTLVSEDGQLAKTHKFLLSANSPLLDTILASQDHPKPLIFMRGAKMDVLDPLLDFFYSGKVEIKGEQLESFMALAKELEVKGFNRGEADDEESSIEADESGDIKKSGMKAEIHYKSVDLSGDKLSSYECNLCEKKSTTLQGLERHKYRYHAGRLRGKIITADLKSPNEVIDAKDESSWKEKGKNGSGKSLADGGIDNVDKVDNVNLLKCNLCEKTSITMQGLRQHKYRYHTAPEEMMAANVTISNEDVKIKEENGSSAVKEDRVGRDVTDDHTDMLPSVELNGEKEHLFSCNSCEKTSKTLQGLQQHKYRYHKSEKGPE